MTERLTDEQVLNWGTEHSDAWIVSMATELLALRAERAKLAAKPLSWPVGTFVTKTKGAQWRGHVVGHYSTALTPIGYCVESIWEPGSVQIYPQSALTSAQPAESGATETTSAQIGAHRPNCTCWRCHGA